MIVSRAQTFTNPKTVIWWFRRQSRSWNIIQTIQKVSHLTWSQKLSISCLLALQCRNFTITKCNTMSNAIIFRLWVAGVRTLARRLFRFVRWETGSLCKPNKQTIITSLTIDNEFLLVLSSSSSYPVLVFKVLRLSRTPG